MFVWKTIQYVMLYIAIGLLVYLLFEFLDHVFCLDILKNVDLYYCLP